MALLRKHPDLKATVVDIENVCVAGREIAEENSLVDRITYLPGDLKEGPFPGGFDMMMLCDVGVFGEALYRRLHASLNSGGRLGIVFHFSPAETIGPAARLTWTFLDSLEDPNFSIPTLAQMRTPAVCSASARTGF